LAGGANRIQELPGVSQPPYLSLVLPAFNEAGTIGHTLTAMRAFLDAQGYVYQVIVAADGDDATASIVSELARSWPDLQLTAQRGRHGKGHGLRRGMRLATGEIVGFLDADYKTPVDEINKVLPWLSAGYQIVAGSRGVVDSQVRRKQRWYRQIGSRLFGICMHTIVGLHHIRDTQCGFKFFSQAAAREIFGCTRIDGYMCDIEILWLAERLGYRVREVGIVWSDDGDSRLELLRGNVQNVLDLLRIRFGRYRLTSSVQKLPVANPLA
jgi:dolichyl-phosphate beta-glucosyltransferase